MAEDADKMEAVEKIADDLYLIKQPYSDVFTAVLVVLGEESVGLVDTGIQNTPRDYIFPLLEKLGRSPADIDGVVNTHSDGDHAGGNRDIKERSKAKIVVHELDPEAADMADQLLRDGDIVKLGDRLFRVIHTPGHTAGSICLYDEKNRTLVTGDSVWGTGLTYRGPVIRKTKEDYINSMEKLKDLEIDLLIMGHPYSPFEKAVLRGSRPREMILKSIGAAK